MLNCSLLVFTNILTTLTQDSKNSMFVMEEYTTNHQTPCNFIKEGVAKISATISDLSLTLPVGE